MGEHECDLSAPYKLKQKLPRGTVNQCKIMQCSKIRD